MSLLRGTVTDNQDPMQRGRCRVRVWGMHKEDDEMLPWAETAGSTMFGLHKGVGYSGVLQVGTTVWVQFEQQDIQCPVIVGVFVGHDVENMGDISAENSDFHPDAKGDKYGQVWMFNTPAGNSFKMDDAEPRIHITTPNGFELDLDDNNRRIRLGTPCGPEIVMECDGKLKISNGCTSITMDGCNPIVVDGDMVVNGHITAQGIFAPNLCYCNSPGSKFEGSMSSQESKQRETNKKCNPTVGGNGETSCHADFPPQSSKEGLDDRMIQLIDEAAAIYVELYGGKEGSFKVCEGKMSPDRYNCLVQSGQDVPKQMVCGLGVLVSPHDKDCDENFKNPPMGDIDVPEAAEDGCFANKHTQPWYDKATGKPLCFIYEDPDVQAMARVIMAEVAGDTGDMGRAVASVVFNRIGETGITPNKTIAAIEAAPAQFSYNAKSEYSKFKNRHTNNALWKKVQHTANQWVQTYKAGKWVDTVKGAAFYANVSISTSAWFLNGIKNGDLQEVTRVSSGIGTHRFFVHKIQTKKGPYK